jgi:hypothetical protein
MYFLEGREYLTDSLVIRYQGYSISVLVLLQSFAHEVLVQSTERGKVGHV